MKLSGFTPGATARVYFSNALSDEGGVLDVSGVLIGSHLLSYSEAVADEDGQVTTTFTVPEHTPLGTVIYAQAFSSVGDPSQQVSVNAAQFDIGVTEAIDDSLSTLSGKCEITADSDPWDASGIFTDTTDVVSNSFIEGSLALLVSNPEAGTQDNLSRFTIHATGDHQEVLQTAPLIQFTSEFALDFDQTNDDDLPLVFTTGLTTVDYLSNTLTLQLNALPAHTTSPFSGDSMLITVDILAEDRRRFAAFSDDTLPGHIHYDQIQFAEVDDALMAAELNMAGVLATGASDLSFFNPQLPTYTDLVTLEDQILLEISDGLYGSRAGLIATVANGGITYETSLDNIVVSKLAAALGISAGYKGFVEAIEDVLGHDLQRLGQHIDNGQWGKAGRRLGNILDKLTSKRFVSALNDKVGKKLAGKILAQIGSKAIPFVGWGLFAGSLVWTLGEQWF